MREIAIPSSGSGEGQNSDTSTMGRVDMCASAQSCSLRQSISPRRKVFPSVIEIARRTCRKPGVAGCASPHGMINPEEIARFRFEEKKMSSGLKTRLPALAAVAIVAVLAASPASAYALICKHGKYDVDSRDEAQLKSAFGTSYCTMRRFSYRSDAENFSKNNNMQVGKSCSCR